MSESKDSETPHAPSDHPAETEFPVAVTREGRSSQPRRWKRLATRLWWLTAVCAVTAVVLVGSSLLHREAEITVRFREGYGIKPGDALRYRGIDVGQVTDVLLSEGLDHVTVVMSLEEKAAGVAREGSQFWIRRPQISLSRMSGLDTVVGAHYIEVLPGPLEGKQVTTFDGLETPPTLAQSKPTEITIRFPSGHGLSVGDVLKHRGIDVGEVRDVRLQDDLRGVEVSLQLVASAGRLAARGQPVLDRTPPSERHSGARFGYRGGRATHRGAARARVGRRANRVPRTRHRASDHGPRRGRVGDYSGGRRP